MRYAALRTLIAISLGLILAQYFKIPLIYLIAGIVVGVILSRFTKGYSLYVAIAFISMLNFNVQKPVSIEHLYNKPVKIIGMIVDEPVAKERVPRYTVAMKKIVIGGNDCPISGKIFAEPRQGKINLRYGDLISYQGKIEPFNFPRNPNLFDLNTYYHRRGILGKIKFSRNKINIIARNKGNLIAQHLIFPLRRYFFKVINHYLKGPQRALLAGMLLGEKQDLPKSVRTAFADTGLAHILAVSGLHVGILVGICILLFSVVGLSRGRWYVLIILGIIIFLYVGITGFRPSAIRAGLMAFLASFGFYLERRHEALNGVFVAGIIILLFSPFALFEIGFQLSFAAAIAIIFFYEKINILLSKITLSVPARKYIFTPLAVSIAAQIGVSPFLVYYFFKLPIINIFANLLIVPLVGFAIPLAFIVIFFNLFLPFLAQIFAETLWLFLSGILFITEKLGNFSFASIDLPRPSVILIIIFYTLIFMLFYLNRPVVRKVFILILLISLNIFAWQPVFSQNQLRVTCLDIYYGDATLVELPNGQNMLVNTGNRKNEILPQFLKSKGIKTIDLLVITNTHPDFYQGVELLKKDFQISKAIIPNDPYSNLNNYLPEDKTIKLSFSEIIKINGLGVNLTVTTPQDKRHFPKSLEIKCEYDNFSMLFAGNLNDLSTPVESIPEITVLKPSYYKYTNWDRVLSSVKAKYTIISERWGVPKWLKGLADNYNTKIYNLRTDGALTITVDNGKVKLKQELKESFAASRDSFY
jgi:competence protein ComEC